MIEGASVSADGALFCSVGDDQAMKVFDVVNFDMINMLKLGLVKLSHYAYAECCHDVMLTMVLTLV